MSTFLHLQYYILLQLRTCLYTGVSLRSYFPTNKTCKTSFTGQEKKKSNHSQFFTYILKNSKTHIKTLLLLRQQIYPKVLLSLLFCSKPNCSHIKQCKLKPSSRPLNLKISSRTHLAHHCKSCLQCHPTTKLKLQCNFSSKLFLTFC